MVLGSENKLKYILNDVATTSKVTWIHRDHVKSQTTEFGKFGKLPKKTVHKLVLDWYSDGSVDDEEFPSPPRANDKQPASALTTSSSSEEEPSPSPPLKRQRKAKRFYDESTDDGLAW